MAFAGRSTRRRGTFARWIMAAIAIVLVVLLIDAAWNSRSTKTDQALTRGAWIDQVLPLISSSTVQGKSMATIWSRGLKMTPAELTREVDAVAFGTSEDYKAAIKLQPPANLAGQAGLLDGALLARSQAAAELKSSFGSTLGSSVEGATATTGAATTGAGPAAAATAAAASPAPSAPAVQAIEKAGDDIQAGDNEYQLFASTLPSNLGVKLPASTWTSDPAAYQPRQAQVFLASLQNAAVKGAVHQVKIYAVTTNPAPVLVQGGVQVMPDASVLNVTVVLADTGNQPEKGLVATASIAPTAPFAPGGRERGAGGAARPVAALQPGQAQTIAGLGPLNPPLGIAVTLNVVITGAGGPSNVLAKYSAVFRMPAPPPPPTTTVPKRPGATATTAPTGRAR